MSLSLSSCLSLCVSLSVSSRGHHWIVRVMSFRNLYFMWVALLKSLECGCLSTIGLQRDGEDDEEKTTVRSVPDGSDKKYAFYEIAKLEYIDHMATFHDSEGTLFPCKICEKVFSRKDILKEHMNNEHKRPYKCPSCPYETAQESRLTRYTKYVMLIFKWYVL